MHTAEKQGLYGIAIIQDFPTDDDLRLMSGDISWVVISFLTQQDDDVLLKLCESHNISISKITKTRDIIDQFAVKARIRYSEFMSNWPTQTLVNGVPFKEKFTYHDEVSYWWLTNASVKQNEFSSTFDYLCYIEIIDSVMTHTHDHCVYTGTDNLLSLLISRICDKYGATYNHNKRKSVHAGPSITLGFISKLWYAAKISWAWAFFKIFSLRKPNFGSNAVGFYTIYPATLSLENSSIHDRNYRYLPDLIDSRPDSKSLFLVSFHPRSIKHWGTVLKSIIKKQTPNLPSYIFLERFLKFRDILLVLANLGFVIRYFILHKYNSTFRAGFAYLGINIYELIGPEQTRCMLGNQLPDSIILARLIERCINHYPVSYLVCFLELYPSARAIYYGASKCITPVKTVAYQHASINSMKLWYSYSKNEVLGSNDESGAFIRGMPLPDTYFFQGQLGLNIISESGYPLDRCLVTGSPRYDKLAEIKDSVDSNKVSHKTNRGITSGQAQPVKVLVVPSLSKVDSIELIQATLRAWQRSHSYYEQNVPIQIIIKPHPAVRLTSEIRTLSIRYNCSCISESNSNLYDLILDSDVVITSYSTAGEEAIALNTPVLCYSGAGPTISSFIDIPAAPIAHDYEELDDMIKKIISIEGNPLYDPNFIQQYKSYWPSLIDNSFYKLDSHSGERMVAELFRSP